jgi:uncharacterized membrane protein
MKKLVVGFFLLTLTVSAMSGAAAPTKYFLSDDTHPDHTDYFLLDIADPTNPFAEFINLDEGPGLWATAPLVADTKVDGDVSVTVFLEAEFTQGDLLPVPFQGRLIKVSLLDVPPSGASSVIKAMQRPQLVTFVGLDNESVPQQETFHIENVEYVVPAGHCLAVKVEKSFDLFSVFPFSVLAPFFNTNLLFDATYTKSFARVPFNISGEGIRLQCFSCEKSVKPNDTAAYTVLVYNDGERSDTVTLSLMQGTGDWNVTIDNPEVTVGAGSFETVKVAVTPPAGTVPGDFLNVTVRADGSTGSDSLWLNTTVEQAEYGVEVQAVNLSVEAGPGDQATVGFVVENTGDLDDSYDLMVACQWNWVLETSAITLEPGASRLVNVTVVVPDDAGIGETQAVALTADSRGSDRQDSDVTNLRVVYEPGGNGGDDDEDDTFTTLLYGLFVAGVVIILLIAYLLTRSTQKMVYLESDERVVEVAPGSQIAFTIRVKNPLDRTEKGTQHFRFRIEGRVPEGWTVTPDKEDVVLEGGDETEVRLTVDIPADSPMDEWTSLDFVAIPRRGPSERANLLITLREPEERLEHEVVHEPDLARISEGDRIVTRVLVENTGEKAATEKTVTLVVNGTEKNRLAGLNISPGEQITVRLPWIAEEENHVSVRIE